MGICYRDMTFCDHWRDCGKAERCHRPLTPEVALAARKWWGSDDAPIAVFVDQPKCWEAKAAL
jgi:hypothetical protein